MVIKRKQNWSLYGCEIHWFMYKNTRQNGNSIAREINNGLLSSSLAGPQMCVFVRGDCLWEMLFSGSSTVLATAKLMTYQ